MKTIVLSTFLINGRNEPWTSGEHCPPTPPEYISNHVTAYTWPLSLLEPVNAILRVIPSIGGSKLRLFEPRTIIDTI
jgi:hypothetical protein